MKGLATLTLATGFCTTASAQDNDTVIQRLLQPPLHYFIHKTAKAPVIDGQLNDPIWQQAAWTSSFVDIEGSIRPAPTYNTHVKMLWDDQYLYIGAELEEPNVWATLTEQDSIVFRDHDFEVFIDPDGDAHNYFEIEINALKTIFDLFLPRPYRNLGSALISWDVKGLKKGVHIDGTLNNPKSRDKKWSVELAIPFASISMGNNVQVPVIGDYWRINFSRVEWDLDVKDNKYVKRKDANGHALPEHNWVWSPQGIVNMHYPERWGYLVFTDNTTPTTFHLPPAEIIKTKLWEVYYHQQNYYHQYHEYAVSLEQLGLADNVTIDGEDLAIKFEGTANSYLASVAFKNQRKPYSIDQEGLLKW